MAELLSWDTYAWGVHRDAADVWLSFPTQPLTEPWRVQLLLKEPELAPSYEDYLASVEKQKLRDRDRFTGADSHGTEDWYNASTGQPLYDEQATEIWQLFPKDAIALITGITVQPTAEVWAISQ